MNGKEVPIKTKVEGKQYATEGREVELVTNHYPVHIKAVPCFQYDIDIKLRKRNPEQQPIPFKGPFTEKLKIIHQMIADWPEVFTINGNVVVHASDGAKNLFTQIQLDLNGKETREVSLVLDGYPEQTFVVDIQFVKQVDLNTINQMYANKTVQMSIKRIRDIQLQVYDIVSSHGQKESHVTVGRSLFPTHRDGNNEIRADGQNTVIALGHFQSLVMTESGLTLNIDLSTTAFRTDSEEVPLEDFIKRELGVQRLTKDILLQDISYLSRRLNNLKISTNHIKFSGNRQKRSHKIDRMVRETPDQKTLTLDSGEQQTITKFFATTHQEVLKHPDWPLVQIKGNEKFLPIELCMVYPNQPLPKGMIDRELQKELTQVSAIKPPERFERIQEARDKIVAEDGENLMNGFGLTIGEDAIKLKGRQLNEPRISGTLNKLDRPAPQGLPSYAFFYMSKQYTNNVNNNFTTFFHQKESLVQVANDMGLRMTRDPINMNQLNLFSHRDLDNPFLAFER